MAVPRPRRLTAPLPLPWSQSARLASAPGETGAERQMAEPTLNQPGNPRQILANTVATCSPGARMNYMQTLNLILTSRASQSALPARLAPSVSAAQPTKGTTP